MTTGEKPPATNDSHDGETETQGFGDSKNDTPESTKRNDAGVLPDGSGDDAHPSHEGQGQESGDQSFDAG